MAVVAGGPGSRLRDPHPYGVRHLPLVARALIEAAGFEIVDVDVRGRIYAAYTCQAT
ncbi:MAG: hypothetical protein WBV37_00175 [Nocardioidaceae bacterium]